VASNRHLGRIVALQTLYEYDFRGGEDSGLDLMVVYKRNIDQFKQQIDDTDFVEKLVLGVSKKAAELDEIIAPIAPDWPVDQIARIDKIILRVALFELNQGDGTPSKVIINEAVELAKAFGGDNSSKFINGVLGTALKNLEEKDGKE